jgi:DNA modification methylase
MDVDVAFYCKDAREKFLDPNSVDLFLCHPPYITTDKQVYGGDLSLQIQNQEYDKYVESYIDSIKHIEYAMKDSGSALVILKNHDVSFDIISKIKTETNLLITKTLIWDYLDDKFFENAKEINGDEFALILLLHKKTNVPRYEKLKNYIIRSSWDTLDEVEKNLKQYEDYGYVKDCFTEELAEILIDNYSLPGQIVVDLFGGTGTTAKVAMRMGRKTIYNDASHQQYYIAKKRVLQLYR